MGFISYNARFFIVTMMVIWICISSCIVTAPVAYQQPAPPPSSPVEYTPAVQQEQAPINLQTFYDALSPYGQWITMPNLGYVWVPSVGPGFVPYSTDGYWAYTEFGWTWASDYSWGWAPFHYGLWDYDNFMGWFWVPNTIWGPAWVSWRSSPGYYGWAPLSPGYNFNNPGGNYYIPPERYVFVQNQYMGNPDINQYYAPPNQYEGYMRNSTVINRTYYDNGSQVNYVAGPDRLEVERATGRTIQPVSFHISSAPGSTAVNNGQLNLYRPAVAKTEAGRPAPAPLKVTQVNEVQPFAQRKAIPDKRPGINNTGSAPTQGRKPLMEKESTQPKSFAEPARNSQNQPAPVHKPIPAQQQQAPPQKNPVEQSPIEKTPSRQAPTQKTPSRQSPTQKTPSQNTNPGNKKPKTKPVKPQGVKPEEGKK
jgi:hypothetical protein